jgi:hypothetical protein
MRAGELAVADRSERKLWLACRDPPLGDRHADGKEGRKLGEDAPLDVVAVGRPGEARDAEDDAVGGLDDEAVEAAGDRLERRYAE